MMAPWNVHFNSWTIRCVCVCVIFPPILYGCCGGMQWKSGKFEVRDAVRWWPSWQIYHFHITLELSGKNTHTFERFECSIVDCESSTCNRCEWSSNLNHGLCMFISIRRHKMAHTNSKVGVEIDRVMQWQTIPGTGIPDNIQKRTE